MGSGSSKVLEIIWFDENINNPENKSFKKEIEQLVCSCKTYDNLEKGFTNFYNDKFISMFTIVSGKLWGKFY